MNNKLFIIGNGFDLAHGMKTKYTDFLLWYFSQSYSNAIGSQNRSYNDTLLSIKFIWDVVKYDCNNIQDISNIINSNVIDVVFKDSFAQKIIKYAIDYNWVDIESEYYKELVTIYEKIEVNHSHKDKVYEDVARLNESLSFIKIKLIEYLVSLEKPKKNNRDISKSIKMELNGFDRYNTAVMFLNFNYTSTIDLYLKDSSEYNNECVNNIHGTLARLNSVIFGYGDEMDNSYEKMENLNKNEFLNNMKSFYYFQTGNYRRLNQFVEMREFDVVIMGHSCGISDRVLLNSIFENDNCKSIKIYYHQKDDGQNDFFVKTQEISRHFSRKRKKEMRDKIIPFDECSALVEPEKISKHSNLIASNI